MNDKIDWPCDKHYAHGPHAPDCDCPVSTGGIGGMHHSTECSLIKGRCPGVKAHPNTMIGGANS